ncbi:hypothetical protein TrST_g9651 [Triparma strigata]|uniref:Uncharacterized protein n=1 Tax=Triparma strigata TaxID=1606541 RepID=A0A9W7E1U2_9STRA|nr:hypothetical protein TrST_g9651 [Triparma strigata]
MQHQVVPQPDDATGELEFLPAANLLTGSTHSDRIVRLLDFDRKGFVSKNNIFTGCFALGLELSISDMDTVVNVDPKLRAETFAGLLAEYKFTIDEVEELIRFFKRTRYQKRPDGYVHLPRNEFFWKRFRGFFTPGSALFIDHLIPKFTAYEKTVF